MSDAEVLANLKAAMDSFSRDDADYDESANLIRAFGSDCVRDLGHQRAVWLCCSAALRMLPASIVMPGMKHTLGTIVATIQKWMSDGIQPDDIATICTPDSALMPSRDQEWSDAESIDMISSLARFALHGGVPDAVDVLDHASICDELRSYTQPNAMPFLQWLRDIGIPAALTLSYLKPDQIVPPANRNRNGA